MEDIYIDIHTHIIPGVDDGSDSIEQTMRMLNQAYEEGIRAIIATPHYGIVNYGYSDKEAMEVLRRVISRAKADYPEIKFVMGNEIYYSQGITEDIVDGKARCLGNSSYVLVEFSTEVEYETIKKAIEEFTFNGFKPIIAHLERYECLKNNIEAVEEIVEIGAYVQLNCRSITGSGFELEKRKKWCRRLLEKGLVHFIASDCHDDDLRKPAFKDAVRIMKKYIGEEKTRRITRENILALIRNESIS